MYSHAMPLEADVPLAAALEAVVASERLAAQLAQIAGSLGHAASVARGEWSGPHREAFDHRVAVVDQALHDAAMALHVLRTRVVPDR